MKYRIWSFVALFALAFSALAAPVSSTLSWTAPTTREDGAALPASEIAGYRVYSSVDAPISDDAAAEHTAVAGGQSQVVTVELRPRPEPYILRFAARTIDTAGRVSALSAVALKSVIVRSTAAPAAPQLLKFTLDCGQGCTITEAP